MSPREQTLEFRSDNIKVDEILSGPASSWDRRIAADLIAEMETYLAEKITTLPEMRRILAVKGYQGLRRRIEGEVEGKTGADALRAMALCMRSYALERPGLSAATFRHPTVDSSEWREAGSELAQTVFSIFAQVGLEGEQAQHALRALRSLVRGFVLNEMALSFLDSLDYQKSYQIAIEMFIQGLSVLRPYKHHRASTRRRMNRPFMICSQAVSILS